MASIPSKEYDRYKEMIQIICEKRDKDSLKRLYTEIQALYGSNCDDLRMLDKYNHKWNIL